MRQPVVRLTALASISDRDWRRGPLPVRDSADFGCEFVEQYPKLSSSEIGFQFDVLGILVGEQTTRRAERLDGAVAVKR